MCGHASQKNQARKPYDPIDLDGCVVICCSTTTYSTMPLFNFNLKPRQPELLKIDITRNRSTESTEDATGGAKEVLAAANVTSSAVPSPGAALPWRTKELSSVFRDPMNISASNGDVEEEDLWALKRCNAFDEDDDSGDCQG